MDKIEVTQASETDALLSELSNLQTWCALMAAKDSGGIPAADLIQRARIHIIALRKTAAPMDKPEGFRWPLGAKVRKKRGSQWRGTVCGFYSTKHTPEGYCVGSAFEAGSVQVWPLAALEEWDE